MYKYKQFQKSLSLFLKIHNYLVFDSKLFWKKLITKFPCDEGDVLLRQLWCFILTYQLRNLLHREVKKRIYKRGRCKNNYNKLE
jgi:hypothetical protein